MLQENTAPYLVTAYLVFLGGMAAYVVSLALRRRNLDREEQVLDQIAEEMAADRNGGDTPGSGGAQRPSG